MKTLRQIHLYLGCIFAPLIIYFSLSGCWQLFRLNDIPKDVPPSKIQAFLHELSKPHKESTLPGLSPKTDRSAAFDWIALFMGLGMITTTSIGITLALRYNRSRWLVALCLGVGMALPVCMLFLR